MKNNRKNRMAFQEHSFWQSYSDMMAALLLTFTLIIAITLSIYRQKTTDLEQTRRELDIAQADLDQSRTELEQYEAYLEQSQAEIQKSNEELQRTLTELQEANAYSQMTQAELAQAYAEIANARAELAQANTNMDSAKAELAATKSELQNIVGIRTDIIQELQNTFSNSSMQVDAQTGSITFSSDVLFRYNSAKLTTESKTTLKEIIPLYLAVLLQDSYRPYIAEIIIEGHTDTDGSYQGNMELSYNRANAVAAFCQDSKNGLSLDKIEQLRQLLTVNGRSYSDPVYQEGTTDINMAASRRVEIKFRLREDEMINKITDILNRP
ncbi:MAG: OmpA family protein [Lachnospiraceae bacterium]|nr:OmpA family protein [Lachnospiraceae bacterium]